MPQEIETKITVEREKSKMIAEIICHEIKESLSKNKEHYLKAKRCENQYSQVTKSMEEGKICDTPWKGAADYFIPMSEWITDAVHARLMNTLFSQEPYMTAKGVEASDVPKQEGITDFMDMASREIILLRENMEFYFKQLIKIPMAVLKYDWVQDYDKQIIKDTAIKMTSPDGQEEYIFPDEPDANVRLAEMQMNGWTPGGQEEVWAGKDVALDDRAKLQYVRFSDYVWSPTAKKGAKPYWEGDRFWLTLNEIRVKEKQGNFDTESVEAITSEIGKSEKASKVEKSIAEREELRECFHYYGRMPFNKSNEIDFEDSEAFEQEIHAIVDYKAKELLAIERWPYKRMPHPDRVYIRESFEDTEEFIGRSLLEKLYMTQKELNTFHNTIMNNAWLSMQKIFLKKRSLVGDEWEKPEVYPGAMWEVDSTSDIVALNIGDVKAIGWEMEQSFIGFAERISNISIYQTGTARQGGNKTAQEVDSTIAEGNIGIDRFIQRCHNLLRKICKWTIAYYFERMPPGLERKIRGENSELIFPTPENMMKFQQKGIGKEWKGEDLAGKFDFVWNGTSISSDKKWKIQVANDLMKNYMQVPMVSGNLLAVWQILKDGLVARGIKDWQSYIPSKESIIGEMKSMQAQRQQQQAVQRDPRIAQMITQRRGLPAPMPQQGGAPNV